MLLEKRYSYLTDEKLTWVQSKIQGLVNRYYQAGRDMRWLFYKSRYPIKIDFTKLPSEGIPVIINNFNRLSLLQTQLEWLLSLPDKISIIIIDNNSTYPPLLKFYDSLDVENVQVIHLGINSWNKGILQVAKQLAKFPKFIVTDSDLIPYKDTPRNIISHLAHILDTYPEINHAGTSLEINDIPESNPLRDIIVNYEMKFWRPENKINEGVYLSLIDTTFAMYRNNSRVFHGLPALRTDRPYTLKHVDWYLDETNISSEYLYYLNTCQGASSWATELKKYLSAKEIKEGKISNQAELVLQ